MDEKLKQLFALLKQKGLNYVEFRGKDVYFSIPRNEDLREQLYAISRDAGLDWLYYAKMLSDLADAGFLYTQLDATKQFEIFLQEGEL